MLRLQILINLLGFCFANTPESGRIVGGEFADIKDFPYQVSYHYQGVIMCGASIIGKEWVLTAAHCVNGISPGDVTLRAGTSSHSEGGLVYKVTDIVKHDRYSHEDFDNDIALAKVKPPFEFGDTVKPIELQEEPVKEGTMAIVSGWGVTAEGKGNFSPNLREVKVPVMNHDKCVKDYNGTVTKNMLCAGYDEGMKDACQGDSGGPLAAGGKLIGVVSFGHGCAESNSPGIYTDVSKFRAWIKDKAGI